MAFAGLPGTLRAAYNGVTELVDHRDWGFAANRRLAKIWFGSGASTKALAYHAALDRVSHWKN